MVVWKHFFNETADDQSTGLLWHRFHSEMLESELFHMPVCTNARNVCFEFQLVFERLSIGKANAVVNSRALGTDLYAVAIFNWAHTITSGSNFPALISCMRSAISWERPELYTCWFPVLA
jgi:hypothetical protein